jgi:FTO catalytic domain
MKQKGFKKKHAAAAPKQLPPPKPSAAKRIDVKPEAFQLSSPAPKQFLSASHPQFEACLRTSYPGFRVDSSEAVARSAPNIHRNMQKAFAAMQDGGLFRVDVTQPFGLGTKCAKTFVTRCLLVSCKLILT